MFSTVRVNNNYFNCKHQYRGSSNVILQLGRSQSRANLITNKSARAVTLASQLTVSYIRGNLSVVHKERRDLQGNIQPALNTVVWLCIVLVRKVEILTTC